jgi:hypothetical protein
MEIGSEMSRWVLHLRAKNRTMEMTGPAVKQRAWFPFFGPEVMKMNPYTTLCDDFGVYVYLNTKMELPTGRETVLHFFDAVQKAFPQMTDFDRRENGEFVLEEDREKGSYRWVTLETQRICTGYVNPPTLEEVDQQHERILEMAPYHLDFSPLDCEAMDVLFAFDFMFSGNHDEVVAEALGLNTTLESLLQLPGSRVINYEPSLMLALDEACRLQSRLTIETRTNAYQIRTGQFPEAPISVYFTVRQYWGRQPFKTFGESYHNQRKICQEMVDNHIIPAVVRPLAQTIAAKQ